MNLLLFLFLLSAISSGLLLCVLKLSAQETPRNQRRQPTDLDLTRLLQSNRRAPLVDRPTEERVKPVMLRSLRENFRGPEAPLTQGRSSASLGGAAPPPPNGHHQHERKSL